MEKEPKERLRKEKKRGVTTQKMTSFRLDEELAEWLATKPNKGRLINELLAEQMKKEIGA